MEKADGNNFVLAKKSRRFSKTNRNNSDLKTQLSGLKNQNIVSTALDERQFRTDESVANDLDMGKTTYRKAKYIYESGNKESVKYEYINEYGYNNFDRSIYSSCYTE